MYLAQAFIQELHHLTTLVGMDFSYQEHNNKSGIQHETYDTALQYFTV